VAHDRFGIRVGVMRVGIPDAALQQIAKAAIPHLLQVSAGQIAAELIDRDLHYELWRRPAIVPRTERINRSCDVRAQGSCERRESQDFQESLFHVLCSVNG
jgi:hypothetical protein